MIRLIKLALFSLIGYAIYEFVRGAMGDSAASNDDGSDDDLDSAMDSDDGRAQTLTGNGQGHREATLDRNGMSVPHQVGRGVVHH